MKRATGKRYEPQRLALLALCMAALAGCEEGFNLQGPDTEKAAEESTVSKKTVELFPETASGSQRDVEAPEVFQVTDAGLWDGRPSLGGIWVAHPDVDQPQRVLIKNTSNDKSITGALFRRDGNLPGPALQVSSSAATELGMLAGSPVRIQVVALRREVIVPEAPAEETEAVEATQTASADTPDASVSTDETEKPAKRKWWQKKPAVEADTAVAVAAGAAAATAVATSSDEPADVPTESAELPQDVETAEVEKPAKRKWWQKKPAEESVDAADVAVAGAAAGAAVAMAPEESAVEETQTAALTDPEVTAPVEKPAKRKWWQKKKPDEITTTTLDPIAGAEAAIEAADPTPVAAATAATTSPLAKPFVQVGTFSVQENADSAAQKVKRNGLSAQVAELKTDENSVWRVLVGPAKTRAERRALLSDVKDLGFTDAFIAKK